MIYDMGHIARPGAMNDAMIRRAVSYNTSRARSGQLVLNGGGPIRAGQPLASSPEFARAVYGFQAMMYEFCNQPRRGGGSDRSGARCANVDGMLGPNTLAQIRSLPPADRSMGWSPLVRLSTGAEVQSVSRLDLSRMAFGLGITTRAVRMPRISRKFPAAFFRMPR